MFGVLREPLPPGFIPPYGHQPRIVYDQQNSQSNPIQVNNPTVSQAFYGILTPNRKTDYYKINGPTTPFVLHLNLLIPDLKVQQPDVEIKATFKDSQGKVVGTLYQPDVSKWTPFYEPFGKDNYLMGPTYNETVPGGKYSIEISSVSTLDRAGSGRYSLAVGDEEVFPPNEIANAAVLIPRLDREFFVVKENTKVSPLSQSTIFYSPRQSNSPSDGDSIPILSMVYFYYTSDDFNPYSGCNWNV